jgi:phage tail protein X
MSNRYDNIPQVKQTQQSKTTTRAVLYPAIPRDLNDLYIRTNSEDRLDMLAYKYYGDVHDWWIIAEANGLGKGTLRLPSGVQLRIPTNTQKIKNDYNNLNRIV